MSDSINSTLEIMDYVSRKEMPRYKSIPNVGLYLEQVVKYINDTLKPLHLSLTASMLSNYVKKGYIDRPVKKQYYADQIAYLIFIVVAKQVLSMENIAALINLQKSAYSIEIAYDYFCEELEYMIKRTFEECVELEPQAQNFRYEKKVLRSVVISVSHIIYLNYCFERSLLP